MYFYSLARLLGGPTPAARMQPPKNSFEDLYARYARNEVSPQELEEFFRQSQQVAPELLHQLLDKTWDETLAPVSEPVRQPRKPGQRVALLALVLVLLCGGGWYSWLRTGQRAQPLASHPRPATPVPGTDRATLVLGDGQRVVLSGAADGDLAAQGTTRLHKQGNTLAYRMPGSAGRGTVLYNTLETPRGGKYRLVLPDGSRVWLDAASSLRFPTAFAGSERRVELTGQAYFEVVKNARQPFLVLAAGTSVRVLGTHFNVMAYADEQRLQTTLLEGAVQVASGSATAVLRPGQQATLPTGHQQFQVGPADTEAAVAWKNELFSFTDADMPAVMRQLARWYTLDVRYQGPVPTSHFTGELSRTQPLADILEVLQASGVHFQLRGTTLLVRR